MTEYTYLILTLSGKYIEVDEEVWNLIKRLI